MTPEDTLYEIVRAQHAIDAALKRLSAVLSANAPIAYQRGATQVHGVTVALTEPTITIAVTKPDGTTMDRKATLQQVIDGNGLSDPLKRVEWLSNMAVNRE